MAKASWKARKAVRLRPSASNSGNGYEDRFLTWLVETNEDDGTALEAPPQR